MVDEEKGKAKITIEIEINEGLMEVVKEGMKNMPNMMPGQKKE